MWLDSIKTVDGMILHTPFDIIKNLIEAVNERCLASGVSEIDDFSKDDLLLHTKNIYSEIQSTITGLIPLHVNHTYNGGDWTGQTTIPNWTESDIIDTIGDDDRFSIPDKLELEREWIHQQYNIVNLLRYIKRGINLESPYNAIDVGLNTVTFGVWRDKLNGSLNGLGAVKHYPTIHDQQYFPYSELVDMNTIYGDTFRNASGVSYYDHSSLYFARNDSTSSSNTGSSNFREKIKLPPIINNIGGVIVDVEIYLQGNFDDPSTQIGNIDLRIKEPRLRDDNEFFKIDNDFQILANGSYTGEDILIAPLTNNIRAMSWSTVHSNGNRWTKYYGYLGWNGNCTLIYKPVFTFKDW